MKATLVTETAFQGLRRNAHADRAVVLAHGAGADMHATTLTTVSDALAAAGIPSLRFQFPYRSAGRRAPDRAPVLAAAVREAAALLARRTKLPADRVVLGGRSMGGRIASVVVADVEDPLPAAGLVLLGYPLHPPGKPEQLRVEHLARIAVPTLFVSGTRDAFGTPPELRRAARRVKGPTAFHWIESGDHGFRTLKSSPTSTEEVLAGAAAAIVEFVASLE
ncbi:MAG TPA: alpha/beta family hydrolase [Acidimicrobiia bacterium]|nr:alpha/beta family hydrolase [Acidimicrobiia bacterium]